MASNRSQEPQKTNWSWLWDVFLKATVPLTVLIGSVIISHEIRISKVEEYRFDRTDAAQLREDIKSWVDANQPPSWLRDSVREIKDDLKKISERLSLLESKR